MPPVVLVYLAQLQETEEWSVEEWRGCQLQEEIQGNMFCIVDVSRALIIAKSNYRKRGSASYIVREVRERERERDTETDGSDVTLVALTLAMSFALFLAKNVHLGIGE